MQWNRGYRPKESVISDATEVLTRHYNFTPSRNQVNRFIQLNEKTICKKPVVWKTNGKGPVESYQYPTPN